MYGMGNYIGANDLRLLRGSTLLLLGGRRSLLGTSRVQQMRDWEQLAQQLLSLLVPLACRATAQDPSKPLSQGIYGIDGMMIRTIVSHSINLL
jgi:hypothetical protein